VGYFFELLGGIVGGWFGLFPETTDESIERWRRRPFLLRWAPIFIGVVVIPVTFIAVVVWLVVDSV
jgi:hypothetical protein